MRHSLYLRYAVSIVVTALALGTDIVLRRVFSPEPFMLFFVAVLVSAWFGGWGPGMLTTVLSGLTVEYFVITPYDRFSDIDPGTLVRLGTFFAVGFVTSTLIRALHRDRWRAETSEAELEAERARLAGVIRHMPIGLLLADASSRTVALANPQASAMLGRPVAIGTPFADTIDGHAFHRDGRRVEPEEWPLARAITTGEIVTGEEITCERPDGTRVVVRVASAPLRARDGSVMAGIMTLHDITDRRRDEEIIRALNRDLDRRVRERTQRLRQSIDELEAFSYTVAHDLRAPLRAIQGFSDALCDDYRALLDGPGRGYLDRIGRATRRMDALILGLLAYSRLGRQHVVLEPVALAAVVERSLARLRAGGVAGAERVTIAAGLERAMVWAHPTLLLEVMGQLLSNALTFHAPGRPAEVTVRVERRDGRERVWVEDHGIGIAPQHHERIFGVFQRLGIGEVPEGTGVGLAIVRRAMERMNGEVGLESAPGEGSRFWIELGAASDVARSLPEALDAAHAP